MRWSWVVVIVVLALAGMAAGCGGDDESEADPTAAWASDFCTAVTTWKDELQSIRWLGFALTEAVAFYTFIFGLIAFFL